jgi:uroporphyrin-III C-methyltransferase/precorrin-2 dehydrogenase/sirohydrochlorin ferrochelatase
MGRYRERFAARRHPSRSLRRFWERIIDGPIGAAALAGRLSEADAALARTVDESATPEQTAGLVYLVGAGPGDPDLLTLRALQALQSADVILYDELVSPAVLDRARRDAERVFAGKQRGLVGRSAIGRLLVEQARRGRVVVRLKGGDPFLFGRGGELDYLRKAGVPVIVVPGVTGDPSLSGAATDAAEIAA